MNIQRENSERREARRTSRVGDREADLGIIGVEVGQLNPQKQMSLQ